MPITTTGAGKYAAIGGGAFVDPTSIAGLVAWYDVDSGLNHAGGSPDYVTTWTDRTGNTDHTLTATASQIEYFATGWSGSSKACIQFMFSNDGVLKTGTDVFDMTNTTSATWFILMQPLAVQTSYSNYMYYLGAGATTAYNRTDSADILYNDLNSLENQAQINSSILPPSGVGTAFSSGTAYRYALRVTSGTAQAYVDGATSGASASTSMSLTTNGTFVVGNVAALGNQNSFRIREIVIYSTALTDPQMADVDTWLVSKA